MITKKYEHRLIKLKLNIFLELIISNNTQIFKWRFKDGKCFFFCEWRKPVNKNSKYYSRYVQRIIWTCALRMYTCMCNKVMSCYFNISISYCICSFKFLVYEPDKRLIVNSIRYLSTPFDKLLAFYSWWIIYTTKDDRSAPEQSTKKHTCCICRIIYISVIGLYTLEFLTREVAWRIRNISHISPTRALAREIFVLNL